MSVQFVRHAIAGAMFSFLALGLLGTPAFAEQPLQGGAGVDPRDFDVNKSTDYVLPGANNVEDAIPGRYKDPREIARNVINIILGFLGVIAVIIILMAGFQWMTAGGEEEKVAEARQRLIQGAIGLVLIIAAWMIAYFVIDQLVKAIQR